MRLWICAAAVNGFLAVALGALAAHGLRGAVGPERLAWIETGSDYGMVHGLALIAVALHWGTGASERQATGEALSYRPLRWPVQPTAGN